MALTYEQHVLVWLQQKLGKYPPTEPNGKSIIIEDVRLEKGESGGDDVVIVFRAVGRPHCLFGFRMLAREPVVPELQGKESEDPEELTPIAQGWVIYANLMERIQAADMGLPKDCATEGITWL